jgi:hypothetical protein
MQSLVDRVGHASAGYTVLGVLHLRKQSYTRGRVAQPGWGVLPKNKESDPPPFVIFPCYVSFKTPVRMVALEQCQAQSDVC